MWIFSEIETEKLFRINYKLFRDWKIILWKIISKLYFSSYIIIIYFREKMWIFVKKKCELLVTILEWRIFTDACVWFVEASFLIDKKIVLMLQ